MTDQDARSAATTECAKRWHYWFASWLRRGYTVTCTRLRRDGDAVTGAYLRLLVWFVTGLLAVGVYVYVALLGWPMLAIWPLLVVVGLSIFKCWTVQP
jgi:ABC-type siderophore export system fused ATPase/permease subunit